MSPAIDEPLPVGTEFRELCHRCRTSTAWKQHRKNQRCLACNAVFPCRQRSCGHLDCEHYRAAAAKAR